MPAVQSMYLDDSGSGSERFRSIGVISGPDCILSCVREELKSILGSASMDNLEWKLIRGRARVTRVAELYLDAVFECIKSGKVRIDVIVWDLHDRRHETYRRDDTENTYRMYYHLICNVARRHGIWEWNLYPDESSSSRWENVEYFLTKTKQIRLRGTQRQLVLNDSGYIDIDNIWQKKSHEEPLVQVADIFAGLGRYSRTEADTLPLAIADMEEEQVRERQPALISCDTRGSRNLSHSQKARVKLVKYFIERARSLKLGISIRTSGYLCTPNPNRPINFWHYEPQSPLDIAPTRDG